MKSKETYMQELKKWLQDTSDASLEEMSSFFTKRLDDYEEHMSVWEKSYQIFADLLPSNCREILDLGCGSGLELDKIWQRDPDIKVTGVDLCQSMLDKLLKKHPDKPFTAVCQDYFQFDPGVDRWDAVISFESLHHFFPNPKKELYQRIFQCLKGDGVFILGDYIACCQEEEDLLRSVYLKKREQSAIPDNCFVHFDIPLTLSHEKELLQGAGFVVENVVENPDNATILIARKALR